ncbi:D-aminoacyl-tRNA deacylase [Candidatus Tiddalikarchaeum anstoanum]|nr:D-aminoacyl-tRNA deacylase [Candidatus Tiddalikarchaeum anstoanum]
MINLVSSTSDAASVNMRKYIEKYADKTRFRIISCDSNLDYAEQFSDAELDLFLSKHQSEKGVKSLSCHTPGNFGPAKFGGTMGTLSVSNAKIQSECLRRLCKLNNDNSMGFEITLEVTHHGPSINTPSLFVEVGSSEEQWNDNSTCSHVASLVLNMVNDYEKIMAEEKIVCIGFGGPHYAPNFTRKLVSDNSLAIGHICPEYAFTYLTREIFNEMINKTVPRPKLVLIDWKGSKKDMRDKIISWSGEVGIKVDRIK